MRSYMAITQFYCLKNRCKPWHRERRLAYQYRYSKRVIPGLLHITSLHLSLPGSLFKQSASVGLSTKLKIGSNTCLVGVASHRFTYLLHVFLRGFATTVALKVALFWAFCWLSLFYVLFNVLFQRLPCWKQVYKYMYTHCKFKIIDHLHTQC
jgi:hypothetical protein